MLEGLPEWIDPLRLAQQNCNLQGSIALARFTRLQDSLCEETGQVYFNWLFSTDEQHRPTIHGTVQTELPMICQRCLQPMHWQVNVQVNLVIMPEGEAEDLPPDYEVLSLTTNPVPLITLIEDEIILAMPIVARHEQCSTNEYYLPESIGTTDLTDRPNPFNVLQALKNGSSE